MVTLHFGPNAWPIGTRGIFVQIFHEFFFSFERIFHFFLGPLNMLSTSFSAKMKTLYSGQNSWPVEHKGIFVQILPDLFFYSSLYFFDITFHFFLRPLNILSTSFRAKMVTLHSGQNSWPVGTRGIFIQILHYFYFFFRKNFPFFSWTTKYAICKFLCKKDDNVFQSKYLTSRTKGHFRTNFTLAFFFIYFFNTIFLLFLRPRNILPTSFHAKMETLHSGQNSWLVGIRVFSYKFFMNFFLLLKEFSIFFLDH